MSTENAKDGFIACFLGTHTLCRSMHAEEEAQSVTLIQSVEGCLCALKLCECPSSVPFTFLFETESLISLELCQAGHTWSASLQ